MKCSNGRRKKKRLDADLVLIHPPSVYDFREIPRIAGPVADLIPSGSVFEMYPIGFSYIGEYLERHGLRVRIVNLASRMLARRSFDVERFLSRLNPLAFGIGLHWLPHCHGAVEIARLCKRLKPGTPVIMGGYSATIFHRELMRYPFVDFVVRGDSTEEPLRQLLEAISSSKGFGEIPNLTYRATDGTVRENEISWVPADLDYLGDNYSYMIRSAARHLDIIGLRAYEGWWSYPMTAVLTCRGCTRNCSFCGGSAYSMLRCYGRRKPAFRSPEKIAKDIASISRFTGAPIFVIGDIRQNGAAYARDVLERISNIDVENTLIFELFEPADEALLESMGSSVKSFALEISPETHDERIRYDIGKRYSNESLERTIASALRHGCEKLDVFFMIGLPHQTPGSVMETVSYCERLIGMFGRRLNPLIGPLAPFLDPGSLSHDRAEEYGYKLFFSSLEDYRNSLLEPDWEQTLSYETRWMTRREIVRATYEAMLRLNRVKHSHGLISDDLLNRYEKIIIGSVRALGEIERLGQTRTRKAGNEKAREAALRLQPILDEEPKLKEQIKWPLRGRRFKPTGIARVILGLD